MEFIETSLKGAWLIQPKVFLDERGFFTETYSRRVFEPHGITEEFIQDNHSKSVQAGVLRGLHLQLPPFTQSKLMRVVRGSVYDVIVDMRKKSPTFGKWEAFNLTAENFSILYVPRGFAHGFCTTSPDTEFVYKVDAFYAPKAEAGIRWNDPELNIPWPVSDPQLSAKDRELPFEKILFRPSN